MYELLGYQKINSKKSGKKWVHCFFGVTDDRWAGYRCLEVWFPEDNFVDPVLHETYKIVFDEKGHATEISIF